MTAKAWRCAVYTRKSSEEGLEQDFNSLDAQREACLAYIASQRGEGWRAIPTRYDDGGFSGGSMERPALQRLLQDIGAGLVDAVVVYKVDRLSRSLADFAKMVELFDQHKASFVSVTQQFNTTTSMGRLTLNVLLSFAQFEREVTGERIRDKIAASKRKGMWMGGHPPLGYDISNRTLVINPDEAKLVRLIFDRYLEIKSVHKLCAWLNANGYRSKRRVSVSGKIFGGAMFFRGQLYWALQNRVYLGEIVHKDKSYPGAHTAIIDKRTWDQVEALLTQNCSNQANRVLAKEPSLLTGLLFDGQGDRMTPSHAIKSGKRYRYYISAQTASGSTRNPKSMRVPARDLEALVIGEICRFLSDKAQIIKALGDLRDRPDLPQRVVRQGAAMAEDWDHHSITEQFSLLRKIIRRITLDEQDIQIELGCREIATALLARDKQAALLPAAMLKKLEGRSVLLKMLARIKRRGRELRLIVPNDDPTKRSPQFNPAMIKAIARAHVWREQLSIGTASNTSELARLSALSPRYLRAIVDLIYLSPNIVEQAISGLQPPELTLDELTDDLPMAWGEQERQFRL